MLGVICAGAQAPQSLRELGIDRIPLLCVDGETILARIARCMLEAGCSSVAVLAPPEVPLPDSPKIRHAAYTGALMSDLLALAAAVHEGELLISSADIPLVTAEGLRAVAEAARSQSADLVYPIFPRGLVELRFGASKRTYVKLSGQEYTGSNVFYTKRDWLLAQRERLARLFEQRKNPVGLARMFGFFFLLRLLSGSATIPYVTAHIGRITQGKLIAPELPYTELGVDLDKPADLETFRAFLDPW